MNNAIFKIQPCNERWDKMSPTEIGRLCSKCDTVVCDATQLDDQQLLQLINESDQQVCLKIQENRAQKVFRSVFHRWKYAIMVVIMSWFFNTKKVLAQGEQEKEAPPQPTDSIPSVLKKVVIKGVVNDSTKTKLTPMEAATVIINLNGKMIGGTFSIDKGKFYASVEDNFVKGDTIEIVVKYLGYPDLKQTLVYHDDKRDFNVNLNLYSKTKVPLFMVGGYVKDEFKDIHQPSNTTTFSSEEIERGNFGR